ncbi:UNKNOWN [Stylonychia lemnae]|uniref:Uncharacterized protein n=1 Tax=Stylonychia lemnae TaxID=5949 RepID=A0A077ZYF2_STYLE|nr:UNKNOWN [Stylonychia lemnae]|eukprot:CDW74232.1 UNKNOWN [Stylonychia lemnae]
MGNSSDIFLKCYNELKHLEEKLKDQQKEKSQRIIKRKSVEKISEKMKITKEKIEDKMRFLEELAQKMQFQEQLMQDLIKDHFKLFQRGRVIQTPNEKVQQDKAQDRQIDDIESPLRNF